MVSSLRTLSPKTYHRVETFVLETIKRKGEVVNTQLLELIPQHIQNMHGKPICLTRKQLMWLIRRHPDKVGKKKINYPRKKTLYFWKLETCPRCGFETSELRCPQCGFRFECD